MLFFKVRLYMSTFSQACHVDHKVFAGLSLSDLNIMLIISILSQGDLHSFVDHFRDRSVGCICSQPQSLMHMGIKANRCTLGFYHLTTITI